MPEPAPGYEAALADQLIQRHPDLVATLEDDLAIHRARTAVITRFIHDPAYDDTARRALAKALHLPEPRPEKPHGH
jgi:hypothetical protein